MMNSRKSSVAQKSELGDAQSKDIENNRQNNGGYSWWKWRRSTDSADKKSPPKDILNESSKSERQSVERVDEMKEVINEFDSMSIDDTTTTGGTVANVVETNADELVDSQAFNADNGDAMGRNDDSISSELADISKSSFTNEKYRKTLRLTSEQIVSKMSNFTTQMWQVDRIIALKCDSFRLRLQFQESLNLKPGMNELQFSVTTAYQGTSRCKCYIFRWKDTDKVVISDIDGTITKSVSDSQCQICQFHSHKDVLELLTYRSLYTLLGCTRTHIANGGKRLGTARRC